MQPTNELEHVLQAAATEPSARSTFYRLLLESPLFALSPPGAKMGKTDDDGIRVAGPNETLQLQAIDVDGAAHVAVFTSLPRLQQAITDDRRYVSMVGRVLLESVRGSRIILNPGSDYGKLMTPEEIAALLDGSLLGVKAQAVPSGTSIRLGVPSRYPQALVDALTPLLRKTKTVRAAYLAMIHEPESPVPPHIVIGIDCDSDLEDLIEELVGVVRGVPCSDPPVDFAPMSGGVVAQYLRTETKPFYKRRLFGFL